MKGAKKVKQWSDESIIEGFQTRFTCGYKAYEVERSKRFLPSARTLRRRLEGIAFDSGALDEVFLLLKDKVTSMADHDKDTAIVFDEMAIQPGINYCTNLDKFIGAITLPKSDGLANHLLVFMIVGLRARWKQIIGYHFTGAVIQGADYKTRLFELIAKSEAIGLRVHVAISDCGGKIFYYIFD